MCVASSLAIIYFRDLHFHVFQFLLRMVDPGIYLFVGRVSSNNSSSFRRSNNSNSSSTRPRSSNSNSNNSKRKHSSSVRGSLD